MPSGSLSLCMIVRNEAELLPRCLASVRDLVAEMVIVDTGSTDDTIAIAQGFGAEVYSFTWIDDFAAARNQCLARVHGEWFLVLDADEILDPSYHETVRQLLKSPIYRGYTLTCASSYEGGIHCGPLLRLARNLPGIHYILPYHEQLSLGEGAQVGTAEEVIIFHDGYLPERRMSRNKNQRALTILEPYLKAHPEDSYLQLKYALELFVHKNYQQILNICEQVLAQWVGKPEYSQCIYDAYLLQGQSLMGLEDWVGAEQSLTQAINQDLPLRYRREGVLLLAEVYLHENRWDHANALLTQALDQGLQDAHVFYYLGISNPAGARTAFLTCLALDPPATIYQDCQKKLAQLDWEYFYRAGLDCAISFGAYERICAFLIDRGLSLLDLGCGTGTFARMVLPLIPNYLGLDISLTALQELGELGQVADLDCPLPFAAPQWSGVTLLNILPYVKNDTQLLQEAWRVLHPGGWLVVLVNVTAAPPQEPLPLRNYNETSLEALLVTVVNPDYLWLNYVTEGEFTLALAFAKKV